MRKLLAVVLMGAALTVITSAAFAQDNMGTDQPAVGTGSNTVDQQSTPFAPNTQAQ